MGEMGLPHFYLEGSMSFKWYMGSLDPVNMLRVVKYNQDFRKQHPEFFDPEGIIVFCGMQGAGKTI